MCAFLSALPALQPMSKPDPDAQINHMPVQIDILEHKETQLKGTERRVHSLQQQVETMQAELSRLNCCRHPARARTQMLTPVRLDTCRCLQPTCADACQIHLQLLLTCAPRCHSVTEVLVSVNVVQGQSDRGG